VRYLARRLSIYAIALWGALTLDYLIPRMAPRSDAFDPYIDPQLADALRTAQGAPGDSLFAQYPHYLGQILRGNIFLGLPGLGHMIMVALPYSLVLAIASTVLAFVFGTLLGAISAWRRGSVFDSFVPTMAMTLSAFPTYFLALAAVYFLSLRWHLFPSNYAHDPTVNPSLSAGFVGDVAHHAELPVLVLVASYIGFWVLSMRTVMVNTLSAEHLQLAHAKGLRGRKVLRSYAVRNAILVPLAMFAAVFSTSLDGIVIIERVFSYQGTGLLFQTAAQANGYVIVQALLLVFTLSVLAVNLVVDVVALAIDPRLRAS
jgi:peptide/nickel transport system permease protein